MARPSVHDHVGLIFCDTRRARSWEIALRRAGIVARVVETIGEESELGACKVSVPRRDLPAANQLVTAVTRGERALPGAGLSRSAIVALVLVASMLAAFVLRA